QVNETDITDLDSHAFLLAATPLLQNYLKVLSHAVKFVPTIGGRQFVSLKHALLISKKMYENLHYNTGERTTYSFSSLLDQERQSNFLQQQGGSAGYNAAASMFGGTTGSKMNPFATQTGRAVVVPTMGGHQTSMTINYGGSSVVGGPSMMFQQGGGFSSSQQNYLFPHLQDPNFV
ncbi:unnamed protein product, partial [Amoebophrya sp. A120]